MKKIFIACFLSSITLLPLYSLTLALPVRAESDENVTKRRPDRATNYSPASSPVGADYYPPVQPEVKQVQTTKSSFLSDLRARIKAFFADIVL